MAQDANELTIQCRFRRYQFQSNFMRICYGQLTVSSIMLQTGGNMRELFHQNVKFASFIRSGMSLGHLASLSSSGLSSDSRGR